MADKKAAGSTAVEVTMTQEKVCKSCVRYSGVGQQGDDVAKSLYIQNAAFEALGEPAEIVVSVRAK